MNDSIKRFIEENIDLIEDNQWEEVYKKATDELINSCGKFTEVMLSTDIHPDKYLSDLPTYFLCGSDVSKFRIPSNIKSIGRLAFAYCKSLTSITIPDSVTSIGDDAFRGCSSLASVTIGNSVTNIGEWAFAYCERLIRVSIPSSVTSIEESAFYGCKSLTNVLIENPEITLSTDVFQYCDNPDIQFAGTKNQWKIIAKDKFSGVTYTCTCSDGVIKKSR